MTKKDILLLSKQIRLALQAKINPLLDALYSMIVVLIGFYILIPYLPNPIGLLLTITLLMSGLSLQGARKGRITRNNIVALLKFIVKTLESSQ
jgi:hypothetical protein